VSYLGAGLNHWNCGTCVMPAEREPSDKDKKGQKTLLRVKSTTHEGAFRSTLPQRAALARPDVTRQRRRLQLQALRFQRLHPAERGYQAVIRAEKPDDHEGIEKQKLKTHRQPQ